MGDREEPSRHGRDPQEDEAADAASRSHDEADAETFAVCMRYVEAHACGEIEGLFGPESVSWTILREPIALAAGPPAVLLQLAHPAVATGVNRFSTFRTDVIGRALRTFEMLCALTFGTRDEAMKRSRQLFRMHQRVRGRVEEPRVQAVSYRANEPHLLRWVAATIFWSLRRTFEMLVRPLSAEEKTRFEGEMQLSWAMVGVLPSSLPASLPAFDAFIDHAFGDEALCVGENARSIAEAIFRSPVGGGPLGKRLITGLLPERFRQAYGLAWGRREETQFLALVTGMRRTYALAPAPLRYVPAWHRAMLRLTRARGERPALLGRCVEIIDRVVELGHARAA